MRHKWANEIIAWANGETIQYRLNGSAWIDLISPTWYEDTEYRIKPKTVKKWQWAYTTHPNGEWRITEYFHIFPKDNLQVFEVQKLLFTEIEVQE